MSLDVKFSKNGAYLAQDQNFVGFYTCWWNKLIHNDEYSFIWLSPKSQALRFADKRGIIVVVSWVVDQRKLIFVVKMKQTFSSLYKR